MMVEKMKCLFREKKTSKSVRSKQRMRIPPLFQGKPLGRRKKIVKKRGKLGQRLKVSKFLISSSILLLFNIFFFIFHL